MSHKQVIVMRKDLGMRKGKMVAQGAHASLKAVLDQGRKSYGDEGLSGSRQDSFDIPLTPALESWITGNFKKVCVYVNSEVELLELYEKAKAAGLICSLITDSGLTEFNGVPTNTCIAVGPDFEDKVDTITGGLPLL